MSQLVLSLFPGIGLLDMAFEQEGFCVVRGPDLLWGGDVRSFHPPAGRFDGVIGGPPCQEFSPLGTLARAWNGGTRFGNLIPDFERCVAEAGPAWFLMENVRDAPLPRVSGYVVMDDLIDNNHLGEQQGRVRRFSFGTPEGRWFHVPRAAAWPARSVAVTGGHASNNPKHPEQQYTLAQMLELQGLPADFFEYCPLTAGGKRKAIGNGVPLPMGRAIARAVRQAIGLPLIEATA